MDIQKINGIFADTAYVRTGGSAEELRCAEYLAGLCAEFGGKAEIQSFPVELAAIEEAIKTMPKYFFLFRVYLQPSEIM